MAPMLGVTLSIEQRFRRGIRRGCHPKRRHHVAATSAMSRQASRAVRQQSIASRRFSWWHRIHGNARSARRVSARQSRARTRIAEWPRGGELSRGSGTTHDVAQVTPVFSQDAVEITKLVEYASNAPDKAIENAAKREMKNAMVQFRSFLDKVMQTNGNGVLGPLITKWRPDLGALEFHCAMILGRPHCKLAGQIFHDLLRQAGAIGVERFRISKFKCRSAQIDCLWLVVQLVVAAVGFPEFRSFRLRTRLTDEETLTPLLIMWNQGGSLGFERAARYTLSIRHIEIALCVLGMWRWIGSVRPPFQELTKALRMWTIQEKRATFRPPLSFCLRLLPAAISFRRPLRRH